MTTDNSQFKIKSFNHTSYTVPDIDRLISFLVEGLGFFLLDKSRREDATMRELTGVPGASAIIALVQGPGHRIELIEYSGPVDRKRASVRPCDNGFSHLAFNVYDIDAAIELAKIHTFEPISPPGSVRSGMNKGGKAVYVRDPDGFTVEFISPPQ